MAFRFPLSFRWAFLFCLRGVCWRGAYSLVVGRIGGCEEFHLETLGKYVSCFFELLWKMKRSGLSRTLTRVYNVQTVEITAALRFVNVEAWKWESVRLRIKAMGSSRTRVRPDSARIYLLQLCKMGHCIGDDNNSNRTNLRIPNCLAIHVLYTWMNYQYVFTIKHYPISSSRTTRWNYCFSKTWSNKKFSKNLSEERNLVTHRPNKSTCFFFVQSTSCSLCIARTAHSKKAPAENPLPRW